MREVLIVEDDDDVRLLAKYALNSVGLHVIEAVSGEQAIDILNDVVPAAALLDIRLPGINGWDVLGHMRSQEHLRDVPVVVCSAELPGTATGRDTSDVALLPKPFAIDALADVVVAMINGTYWRCA